MENNQKGKKNIYPCTVAMSSRAGPSQTSLVGQNVRQGKRPVLGLNAAQTSVEHSACSDWNVLNFTFKTPKLDLMTKQRKNPVDTTKYPLSLAFQV